MLNETISNERQSELKKAVEDYGLWSDELKKLCKDDKEFEFAKFYDLSKNVEYEILEADRDGTMKVWLDNQLEIKRTRRHTEVLITYGGPTIRLLTGKKIIRQTWGFTNEYGCEMPINRSACKAIDDYII